MCFFKQKAAYEVRISDWSSDVCSSDLGPDLRERPGPGVAAGGRRTGGPKRDVLDSRGDAHLDRTGPTGETEGGRRRSRAGAGVRRRPDPGRGILCQDRTRVMSGKSVSIRVDLVGRGILKENKSKQSYG